VFNLGADKPYSVLELAEAVQSAMARRTGVNHLEARQEVQDAISDHGKAHEVLGAEPSIDLECGLKRMAAWALTIGPREASRFGEIEIPLGLPPSWRS
jgi:UDP-glucose 4-epimerase